MKKAWFHVVLLVVALIAALIMGYQARWADSSTQQMAPEIIDELDGPDRGFYYIHNFYIHDDMDCEQLVKDSFTWGNETDLALIEINLQDYCDGEISEAGLQNIGKLFSELRTLDKRYIVRFLYDWEGKNVEHEPRQRTIILRHMEQLGGTLNRYRNCIFTLQGLFVGNWGEMNGTTYMGTRDWRALTEKLASVTDTSIYLAVRTPQQWRSITGSTNILGTSAMRGKIPQRLGLFNDGMMGSESDVGTYGDTQRSEDTYDRKWNRTEELAFQNDLCRSVPNGGEVIYDTNYNDFPQAIENLRIMHVSYLNRDYDHKALDKWEEYRVEDGSLWDGMDGLTYIDRHLGYRYVMRDVSLFYLFWDNRLHVTVNVANEGFAPIYREVTPQLVFVDKDGVECAVRILSGDLRTLAGGNDDTLALHAAIPLGAVPQGDYDLYLRLYSDYYGQDIPLANAGRNEDFGYQIGTLTQKISLR